MEEVVPAVQVVVEGGEHIALGQSRMARELNVLLES